jgi:signal transduction histidine kinase
MLTGAPTTVYIDPSRMRVTGTVGLIFMLQDTDEPLLDRLLAIRDFQGLQALGDSLLAAWKLEALEIKYVHDGHPQVVARSGRVLPSFTQSPTDDRVRETEGVWSFALGNDEPPRGWLRVQLGGAPCPETLERLQLLSRRLHHLMQAMHDRDRVHELERQLEVLQEQAGDVERLKEEFLSNLSHELRTPLTSILGFSEYLLERLSRDTVEYDSICRVKENGDRLLQLLNRLLELAKLQADRASLQVAPADADALIAEACDRVRPNALAKGLLFECLIDGRLPEVDTDGRRFSEALCCVLENAVKFTDSGRVRVRARMQRDRLVVEVSDTGRGIDGAHVAFLFDAFWQGDGSMTRAVGGNGIGLALANRFMNRLGGDIQVKSTPGAGTTVTLSLPRVPLPTQCAVRTRPDPALQFRLPF